MEKSETEKGNEIDNRFSPLHKERRKYPFRFYFFIFKRENRLTHKTDFLLSPEAASQILGHFLRSLDVVCFSWLFLKNLLFLFSFPHDQEFLFFFFVSANFFRDPLEVAVCRPVGFRRCWSARCPPNRCDWQNTTSASPIGSLRNRTRRSTRPQHPEDVIWDQASRGSNKCRPEENNNRIRKRQITHVFRVKERRK